VINLSKNKIRYTHLNASTADSPFSLAVAVPSRLYFQKTKEKPLNGPRVAIKDNIDLHGVRTCGMSRSYFQLYPPSSKSAFAVQRLINLGAIIVGKTGMNQFADAEDPTGDYVDFHCPFNPRGDGYRSPGGSSSGAGSAAGAYEWLDFSVGTDSGGI
jgi:Asp-tRNA(Asn)/Glu-tRNA(Gln) amidotransferase A subunit family amidase